MSASGSRLRPVLIAGGVLVMVYALVGAVTGGDVNLVGVPVFLVAVLVLHDGVFLPVVLGVGALVRRFVPERWRSAVRAGAVVSLAVSVVAAPLVLGFGRSADNSSALPRAYGWGLILILILIWGVSLGIRKRLERRRRRNVG
jgi:uncharacterized membrane protein YeaQ/YmgE (transglycosylase-associated protein family)